MIDNHVSNAFLEKISKSADEDFFHILSETVTDAIIIIDSKGSINFWNRAAESCFGYMADEIIGKNITIIMPERFRESHIKGFERTMQTGQLSFKDKTVEMVGLRKDESEFPIELSLSLWKINGETFSTAIIRDISVRKLMEENLKSSEGYFRSFMESSMDSVCNISLDGELMSINHAGCSLNALDDQSELVGENFAENIVENRKDVEYAIRQASQGKKMSMQYKAVTKKGEEIWWDSRFSPVEDIDGSIKSILVVARDITKQKELETSLRYTRKMLVKEHEELNRVFKMVAGAKREWEKTMDCVGDMVLLADDNGKIKRVNKSVVDFAKKSYENILGNDIEEFFNENSLQISTFYSECADIHHEPTKKWFTLRSYPFKDEETGISGNVLTLHDSTDIKKINTKLEKAYDELKATQAQILQREKMASIGQLAAGVAHEINNPMGFISSNLGTLQKYLGRIIEFINVQSEAVEKLKSPEVHEQINETRKKLKLDYILEDIGQLITESLDGADRVKKIVHNLKSFSRIDEAEYKEANINECIESTLNIVWNELKYKATLDKELGDIPLTKCYPQQLNQVFMNLLVNSAQAIEKQGEIKIKTWNGDGLINIMISDTGEGIPEDKLDRIFEPFFTTKPVGKGTGLGLSITYDIVKKHNGEISVESKRGKGTTFTIKIPVAGGK